jgi:thiamine pyrophosphokinase
MKTEKQITSSCVILANGMFPTHPAPLDVLQHADTVVCCDGAVSKSIQFGQEPDFIVGDMDSLSPLLKERFADRLFPSPDQETNDLTKAVTFCRERGAERITILGASGLREDHLLGNVSLLADYTPCFASVDMMTDYGIFTVMTESGTLKCHKGQQISIFALNPEAHLSAEGLKYPIHDRTLSSWWQGTLNEALGENFSLRFSQGKWIIFCCY